MEGPNALYQHERDAHSPMTIPSSPRCAQCNAGQEEVSRNLVLCIDENSSQFGQNNTNVMKMFDMVHLETTSPKQYAYYSDGIGTRPKSSSVLGGTKEAIFDGFDTAIACNLDKNIKEAYGWLAGKYQEGDQIYLFGFSRGAYQVRVLAGMMQEVGLIRTPTEKQIAMAYNHYKDIRPGNPEAKQIARRFKKTFSWKDLRVHFIGVWDTVGLTRGNVSLSMSSSACHIRHALALDEHRVRFMPKYIHETRPQTHEGESDYAVTSLDVEHRNDDSALLFGAKKSDIKEVWFAGNHTDVGGRDSPGKFHQAGNVSLLWMRREVAAYGLVLQPTDVVWMPDDLDFGIGNSMSAGWRIFEYLAIKHQVSYSGVGGDAHHFHQLEPRHIMPGQKLHASILYANAYKPQATLGEGFEIPIIRSNFDETELDGQLWETGFFDNTTAREILARLGVQQGTAPIYLDRLLFMLRFNDGKRSVRDVPNWQEKFEEIIKNDNCVPLDRLVSIVAYYEASCDSEVQSKGPPMPRMVPSQGAFNDARKYLRTILAAHRHRDNPRAVALLRPLTKREVLRQRILTHDILKTFVNSLDAIIQQPGTNFVQVMDSLGVLLRYEETRKVMIEGLGINHSSSDVPRVCRILETEDQTKLVAALRMMTTLSQYPEGKALCSMGKPRMRELARKHGQIIGPLATEVLLTLHQANQSEPCQLSVHEAKVRENIASALVHLRFDSTERCHGEGRSLHRIFALDATELSHQKRVFIEELTKTVQKGNTRGRTAATMILLKLCEAVIVRDYFREIGLLVVFVNQLQRKNTALLAAYALAVCLKYSDTKESIKDNELFPKYIVSMLQEDYFDDTVGQVEGFQIFASFMQHDDLRTKVKGYNITKILETKLKKERLKETRTSLIYLDIFLTFDQDGTWTHELVRKSLRHLQNTEWRVQKAGVAILSALAITEYGVAAIKPWMSRIIEMLLPEGYLLNHPSAPRVTPKWPNSLDYNHVRSTITISEPMSTQSVVLLNAPSRPASWMMGPACALRNLAQNKTLRDVTRETIQYSSLKHLYLSATLIQEKDTSPWCVKTPDRTDVIDMIDKVIKAVDEELLSEEGLMTIGDTLPPHIQHWDRLGSLLRDKVMVIALPALLGIPVAAMLAVVAPIYLSFQAYESIRQLLSRYRRKRALDRLSYSEDQHSTEADLHFHEGSLDDGRHGDNTEIEELRVAQIQRWPFQSY